MRCPNAHDVYWGAVVGVQNRALVVGTFLQLPADDGHAQRVGDQLGAHMLGNLQRSLTITNIAPVDAHSRLIVGRSSPGTGPAADDLVPLPSRPS
jgi:hypothetical protein